MNDQSGNTEREISLFQKSLLRFLFNDNPDDIAVIVNLRNLRFYNTYIEDILNPYWISSQLAQTH